MFKYAQLNTATSFLTIQTICSKTKSNNSAVNE